VHVFVPPLNAAGLSQRSCEKTENPENPRPQVVDLQMRFFAVRRVLPIFSQLQRDNRYRSTDTRTSCAFRDASSSEQRKIVGRLCATPILASEGWEIMSARVNLTHFA